MEIISRKDALQQGLKQYFTGKPCKRGHLDWRWVKGYQCVECKRKNTREWLNSHPTVRYANRKRWQGLNREKHNAAAREYRRKNPEKVRASMRRWNRANREYQRLRVQNTPHLRIADALRTRLRNVLRGKVKAAGTEALVGCSWDQLLEHLEKQFRPGMSWDNYGEWEVDHILPCASFDLEQPAAQRICFHFTNLQPLWKAENRSKGARILDRKGLGRVGLPEAVVRA